jgi:hypothetical protein
MLFFAEDLVQHYHVMRQLVDAARIQSQSFLAGWDQTGSRQGIAARKQSDIVAETDQFLRKPRYDTLRTPI